MPVTELNKTIFAASLRTIKPTENDLQEVKASLGMLKNLLPPGVNPEDEPDLLFIVANVAVAGLVNLNDDGLDIPTALRRYKKFEKKFVDIEHDRSKVRGYILHAGLSELDTDRVISEEEARRENKPFNISTVAVLWRSVDKQLCNFLENAANPAHPDFNKASLSFEMAFPTCYLITLPIGEREIARARRVIYDQDADFDKYLKALRANKGSGLSPDDDKQRVYRIMPPDVIPLGEGIVAVPAAQVKGIAVIEENPMHDVALPAATESGMNVYSGVALTTEEKSVIDEVGDTYLADYLDAAKRSLNDFCDKLSKNCVSALIPDFKIAKTMKYADLQKVKEQATTATKIEDLQVAFASAAQLAEILNAESEKIVAELNVQKNVGAALELAKQEAVAAQTKLATEFSELKKELDQIKAAQAEALAEEQFNARMTTLDEEFELDKEERALLIDEVRSANEETFAKFMAKNKVLLKEKSKKNKSEAAKKFAFDKKAKEEADEAECKAKKAKEDEEAKAAKIDFKEVIASAVRTDAALPNAVINGAPSLKEQAAAAFADVVIGGKKVSEIKGRE